MNTQEITPKSSHKKTVENLDIVRYMGRWHEIARYENIFKKGLMGSRPTTPFFPTVP